jgi:uncharacterized protein (TIGR03083 family)
MPEQYVMRTLIAEEQRDFADMLRGLTDEQWDTPSLCENWTVHDAVIHITIHTHTRDLERFTRVVRNRLSDERMHAPERVRPKKELIDELESPAVLRPGNLLTQLSEWNVLQQDVRRPVGIARALHEDRLAPALDYAVTFAGGLNVAGSYKRSRGLRLVATDMSWTAGTGPEVRGPGEAIFMAINGRAAALADLEGPGTDRLTARLS